MHELLAAKNSNMIILKNIEWKLAHDKAVVSLNTIKKANTRIWCNRGKSAKKTQGIFRFFYVTAYSHALIQQRCQLVVQGVNFIKPKRQNLYFKMPKYIWRFYTNNKMPALKLFWNWPQALLNKTSWEHANIFLKSAKD